MMGSMLGAASSDKKDTLSGALLGGLAGAAIGSVVGRGRGREQFSIDSMGDLSVKMLCSNVIYANAEGVIYSDGMYFVTDKGLVFKHNDGEGYINGTAGLEVKFIQRSLHGGLYFFTEDSLIGTVDIQGYLEFYETNESSSDIIGMTILCDDKQNEMVVLGNKTGFRNYNLSENTVSDIDISSKPISKSAIVTLFDENTSIYFIATIIGDKLITFTFDGTLKKLSELNVENVVAMVTTPSDDRILIVATKTKIFSMDSNGNVSSAMKLEDEWASRRITSIRAMGRSVLLGTQDGLFETDFSKTVKINSDPVTSFNILHKSSVAELYVISDSQ